MMKEREVEAKKLMGKKNVKGKSYEYQYYTLPLNLYLPKAVIEKFGTKFVLQIDEDNGTIVIKPKSTK